MNRAKICVECGDHVPAYQKFFCEECWRKALNAKLLEDEKRAAEMKQVDIEHPDNEWFR